MATRNVLVYKESHVQITDFGLSKVIKPKDEEIKIFGGMVPVRWLAIETLREGIYSHKTDVWAYGNCRCFRSILIIRISNSCYPLGDIYIRQNPIRVRKGPWNTGWDHQRNEALPARNMLIRHLHINAQMLELSIAGCSLSDLFFDPQAGVLTLRNGRHLSTCGASLKCTATTPRRISRIQYLCFSHIIGDLIWYFRTWNLCIRTIPPTITLTLSTMRRNSRRIIVSSLAWDREIVLRIW